MKQYFEELQNHIKTNEILSLLNWPVQKFTDNVYKKSYLKNRTIVPVPSVRTIRFWLLTGILQKKDVVFFRLLAFTDVIPLELDDASISIEVLKERV
jgi:hypothetical protein